MLAFGRGLAAQELDSQQDGAIERERDGDDRSRRKDGFEGVLEEETQDAGRDGADDQQPAELGVGVVGADLALRQRARRGRRRSSPVAPEEAEQDERRRQMRQHEERQEGIAAPVDRPVQDRRDEDRVPEARNREQLGDPLQRAEDDACR